MDGLEAEWDGRVQVVRLNVHDLAARPLITRLGYRFTPTYILFDGDGREVWRTYGVINAAEARRRVEALENGTQMHADGRGFF